MKLHELNALGKEDAASLFRQCCTSERWVRGMTEAMPFTDSESLLSKADELWSRCEQVDFLQAFDGHPKIGDVSSLKKKYASTQQMAGSE